MDSCLRDLLAVYLSFLYLTLPAGSLLNKTIFVTIFGVWLIPLRDLFKQTIFSISNNTNNKTHCKIPKNYFFHCIPSTKSDNSAISAGKGFAPVIVCTTIPLTNSIKVGIEPIFSEAVNPELSSTLTLTTFNKLEFSAASCSNIGSITLQGLHHSAQKSTRTGVGERRTSWAKVRELDSVIIGVSYQSLKSMIKLQPWKDMNALGATMRFWRLIT